MASNPTPEEQRMLHERELAAKREEHERQLERFKARTGILIALLGISGVVLAAVVGLWAKQTSEIGVKLNAGVPSGFWDDFHKGIQALEKLSDSKTPINQIVQAPAPTPSQPTAVTCPQLSAPAAPQVNASQPASEEVGCIGLDSTNWVVTPGPVTHLLRGYNINLSIQNKSSIRRDLTYFGDPALTDDLGDRLTFLISNLPHNDRSPLVFAPQVEMPIDLTFPNGSFATSNGRQTASVVSFTLPIHEMVNGITTVESLACINLAVPNPDAK